ncbi:DUF1631 domain-containing protein [SAR92 clade bacterium H231]|nr:DUF1631 domain-containing protein [SAR92 clade bacterium H231]
MIKGLHFSKKEHINSLRQSCRRHLETVCDSFFELASTSLLAMADRAETNRLQTLYLDAQRLVRTRRYAIESLLLERTMNSFAVLDSGQSAEPGHNNSNSAGHNTPYNHLELLGNEDLEVMIALDNGTTKALETFKQPLYLLHRRFQTLVGSDLSSAKPVPMSPDALLECFSEAICHDQIAVEIQVVLINLFNQLCFDKSYGQLLDQVNQELEHAGVLPVPEDSPSGADQRQPVAEPEAVYTDYSVDRNNASLAQRQALTEKLQARRPVPESLLQTEPSAETSSEPSAETFAETPAESAANTRIQTELLARISTILANAGESLDHGDKVTISRQQLFAEIDKQISYLLQEPTRGSEAPGQLSYQLEQTLNTEQGEGQPRLHGNDSSVFKLVGSAFARFGQINGVAPEAQQLINRCELPLLKLALAKPSLLEQENHPIRRLFNEMAKYAIGLESGSCVENSIYKKMLHLSEKMLANSFNEAQIPLMLSEFMSAIDIEAEQAGAQAQRQVEQVAAAEKVNWARTRVDKAIAERLMGVEVPVAILNFVEQHWCKLLHIAHLRGGEGSTDWRRGLHTLDQLLAVESTPLVHRDMAAVEQVLADIESQLQKIAIDAVQLADQMERLRFILDPALPDNVTPFKPSGRLSRQQANDQIKRIVIESLEAEMPGENIAQAVAREQELASGDQDSLAELQKGCWIELSDDIKSPKRGKLAGIVGPSWKYVFVNSKGKLVAALNRARLAEQIRAGEAVVLDDSGLFDKAIRAAINDIKELSVAS